MSAKDNASISSKRSISNTFKKYMGGRKKKESSKSNFFTTTKTPSRTPESEPSVRPTTKEQVKENIQAENVEKKETLDNKNEQMEQDRKANEKASGPEIPNFDRDAGNKEPKKTEPSTAPYTRVGVANVYTAVWEHEEIDMFRDKVYSQFSFWTPNAMSLFESLRTSHRILANNEHLRWVNRDYMSFPVTLYYAVLYYIRILQVREYFNINSAAESRFFRKFERAHKLNSLPIVGFLVPFFGSIAAYDPSDPRQTWLIPSLNGIFRAEDGEEIITDYRLADNGANFVQPNIPMLYDFWKAYCIEDNLVARYRVKNTFAPMHHANTPLGLGYETVVPAAMTVANVKFLGSWGIDTPHPESFEKYVEAAGYWRDSKFRHSGPNIYAIGNNAITTIGSFLRMENSMTWFDECISAALEHAKFFQYPKFLSDMDPLAGMEIGLMGRFTYLTNKSIRTGGAMSWYNGIVQNPTGGLSWYEENVRDYHKLNFRHVMTNCSVNVKYRDTADGNNNNDRAHHFAFTEAAGTRAKRWGPWYDCDSQSNAMTHRTTSYYGGSAAQFEVFDRRDTLIRNRFYIGNPKE